jgi:hypothetical protein
MQTAESRVKEGKPIGLSIWILYPGDDAADAKVYDTHDDRTIAPFLLACIDNGATAIAILGFQRQKGGISPLVVYCARGEVDRAYFPLTDGHGIEWRQGQVIAKYSHLFQQAQAQYN